uniref:Uncharacterized protein n=1 Tax=Panagrolaimus sp. ES5 TaxID=591445 RepID=A0AC34F4K6_9BILA
MGKNMKIMKREFQAFMLKNSTKDYFVKITAEKEEICFEAIDAETEQPTGRTMVFDNGKQFVENIPIFFSKQIKAVILHIFSYKNHGYKTNYEFCKVIREKLILQNIPYSFTTTQQTGSAALLIASNYFAKIGDIVFLITITGKESTMMNSESDFCMITEFEFTKNGYEKLGDRIIDIFETTRNDIFGSYKPVKIIGYATQKTALKYLQNLFKFDENLLLILKDFENESNKFICKMGKWLKRKSLNQFYVSPTTIKRYAVVGVVGGMPSGVITGDEDEKLPIIKTAVISKTFQEYLIILMNENGPEHVEGVELNKQYHKVEITFKIDENNFFSTTSKNIIVPEIRDLPKTLDKIQKPKIPVIGFWGNSSVICIKKKGEKYKFMDSWNGIYGNELFLNFNQKRPILDTNLTMKSKMDTVVFDVLKILSMQIDDIKINEAWKFKFTKNDENPILIEYDNFEGDKKAASPTFLMAILLRQHLKAVKNEIGEKPEEIGICLFDEFNVDERKRVEEKLQEACQLLQIRCNFIKI